MASTVRAVTCRPLRTRLHTPFVTALRRTEHAETLVVEVECSGGAVGRGEAPQVWAVTGESLASAEACISGPLTEAIHGRPVDDLNALLRSVETAVVGNCGAKSAVDVALHDLAAQRAGLPLHAYLGAGSATVTTDVTVSAGAATDLAATARMRVRDGFRALKLKVGTDAERDVSRVLAVRDAVGTDVTIRLDANQGWDPKSAIGVIRALEDAGADIELVEQPVAAADIAGLARVTRSVDTPVMADESVFGIRDLVRVIQHEAADMVNVKLAKCGGLHIARTMLELARSHGLGTMVGSMMEGSLGVGATAALAAACPTSVTSDLDAAWWAATSPVHGGLTYHDDMIQLPDAPGLGVEGIR